jgi:hypothetical protein
MGRKAASTAGSFTVNWGLPAAFSGATQMLVTFWVKVLGYTGQQWGPAPICSDFANKGWWIFNDTPNDTLAIETFGSGGGTFHTALSNPLNGQGWVLCGIYMDSSSGLATWKGNALVFSGTGADGQLNLAGQTLMATTGSDDRYLAEIGIFCESDGSLGANQGAIMSELAAGGGTPASLVTTKTVKFYAPLGFTNNDIAGGAPVSGVDATWVDAGDHPFTPVDGGATPTRRNLILLGAS